MHDHLVVVLGVIERPEYQEPDPRPGRVRYFARGGPQPWLRVVVEFTGSTDRVVTAIPQANAPNLP